MFATDFYDVDLLGQIAINLFYGWGYNFYRSENQIRADDLMIRSKACWLLNLTNESIKTATSKFRREEIPPLSRANPLPDPIVIGKANLLDNFVSQISKLEGNIRALPVPENDRMTQRYRNERVTLQQLLEVDKHLIGQAELLRKAVREMSASEILASSEYVLQGISALKRTIEDRQAILR